MTTGPVRALSPGEATGDGWFVGQVPLQGNLNDAHGRCKWSYSVGGYNFLYN